MTHDIDDLLEIITELEKRIIELERKRVRVNCDDSWYWNH